MEFLATESSLKVMENAFYFTLKALFVLKIFKFDFFVMQKNVLIKKKSSTSKFMTSEPGKQTVAIDILPNIQEVKATRQ